MSYELVLQPNRWSCLPTAFAIILHRYPCEIIEFLGHDGSEIIWPDLEEPYCRRAFHIQEMYWYALTQGYVFTPIEPRPCILPTGAKEMFEVPLLLDFESLLHSTVGVLVGEHEGHRHAVAWDGEKVLDPMGYTYPIKDFGIEAYHIGIKSFQDIPS